MSHGPFSVLDTLDAPLESPPISGAAAVLRAKGRTFHWAARLLDSRYRERATRLYAFCRRVDDLADGSGSPRSAHRALQDCRAIVRSGNPGHPRYGDMVELMRECRMDCEVVLELVDGVAGDLQPVRIESTAALLQYCYRVAGTVGLMMCSVLDLHAPAARAHAIDLGIAMQLTNLCRDVAEDAAAGRRYLPRTLVGDLDPSLLTEPAAHLRPTLAAAIASLLRLADAYYSSGARGLAFLPLEARIAISVAAGLYRAIGTRLIRRNCDYWSGRIMVGPATKLALTTGILVTRPFTPRFWTKPSGHDASLHLALASLPPIGAAPPSAHDD